MTAVQFERTSDGCCSICNPVALADLETECVKVYRADSPDRGIFVCRRCIQAMRRSMDMGGLQAVPVDPEVATMLRSSKVIVDVDMSRHDFGSDGVCRGCGFVGFIPDGKGN